MFLECPLRSLSWPLEIETRHLSLDATICKLKEKCNSSTIVEVEGVIFKVLGFDLGFGHLILNFNNEI